MQPTILIVDDRAINRKFLSILLVHANYRVLEASDGAEALDIVRQEYVALIISDILMPVMDGIEFANRVHADPGIAHIPIIFYTATYRANESRILAQSCGVHTVLAKPAEPQRILDAVASALGIDAKAFDDTSSTDEQLTLRLPVVAGLQSLLQAAIRTSPVSESNPELETSVQADVAPASGNQQSLSLRTAALLELSMTLPSERDPQHLLELFCRAVRDIMHVKHAAVGIGGNDQPKRYAQLDMSTNDVDAIFEVLDPRTGTLHDVLFGGDLLRAQGKGILPVIDALPPDHPLRKNALVVPIMLASHPYGWLYVAGKLGISTFNQEDEQCAATLAVQLAPIYENLVLYDEVQRHAGELMLEMAERQRMTEALQESETRFRQLAKMYAVLSDINSAIVRIHDRDKLFQEACRVAVSQGAFSMAWIGVVDPDMKHGEIVASYGGAAAPDVNLGLSACTDEQQAGLPACAAIREMRPAICNNVEIDPSVASHKQALLAHGYRALAVWPLLTGQRTAAILALFAPEADFFDDDQIKLLDELAGDLSFGLRFIEKEEKLNYLAYYDVLTGLPNSALFHDRLTQFLHSARYEKKIVAVVMLDLQHFAHLNDAMGRNTGDAVLKEVATRLQASLREPFSLARIGGDRFAIAVTGLQQSTDVISILEQQIFNPFKQSMMMDRQEIRVAVQAGLALYPEDGEDTETLFTHAEVALKKAKASGEPFLYYAPQMNATVAVRLAMENKLRVALEEQQFTMYYQPRIDLRTGRIVSAEALIRWNHPQHGQIPPGVFIPVAEANGFIVPIGAWAIDAVCWQQTKWLEQNVPIVPVAVNLSTLQFKNGKVLQTIRDTIRAYGLETQYIEFELTESIVMNDPEEATRSLQALKAMGVKLSLDDFGTGYSSLAYLKRFPFDFVKIDRTFVSNITRSPEDAAIAIAVIAMAHSLNLRVVAEGVETEGQLQYLCKHRCDEMQGYLFSPPVTEAEFEAMLLEGKRLALQRETLERANTLLVVDDDPNIISALKRLLRRDGYNLLTASSGSEALELLAINAVQVIVSDQRMPDMSGAEFLGIVKGIYPDTIRIILSGYTDLEVIAESVNRGEVFKFLTKPWEDDLLREQIRDAFRRYRPAF